MTEKRRGRCHCGAVEFEVILDNGLENLRRCNCSLCSRKGAIMASVPVVGICITRGEDNLSLYRWNTGVAKHYFCKTCGIYTHHQRRSNPEECGFNVACLEGVDLESLADIQMGNGAAMSLVDSRESRVCL